MLVLQPLTQQLWPLHLEQQQLPQQEGGKSRLHKFRVLPQSSNWFLIVNVLFFSLSLFLSFLSFFA
jgi:hypothetical protein